MPTVYKNYFDVRDENYSLTPELMEEICEHISNGMPEMKAFQFSGIPKKVYYEWRKLSEEEGFTTYKRLWNMIEIAEAKAEADAIKTLRNAYTQNSIRVERKVTYQADPGGELKEVERVEKETEYPPDWTAATWVLERRDKNNFSKTDSVKIENPEDMMEVIRKGVEGLFNTIDENEIVDRVT